MKKNELDVVEYWDSLAKVFDYRDHEAMLKNNDLVDYEKMIKKLKRKTLEKFILVRHAYIKEMNKMQQNWRKEQEKKYNEIKTI